MLGNPNRVFRRRPVDQGRIATDSAVDGEERSLELEMKLNQLAAQLFTTGGGKEFLDYLKLITMGRIVPASADSGVLYYYEGARWIVGLIQARVAEGQKQGKIGYVPPQSYEDPPLGA